MQKSPTTLGIVRHVRYTRARSSNLGGITFTFDLDHTSNQFKFGYAVCNRDDNFSKFRGRELADKRKATAVWLPLNKEVSLVDNAVQYVLSIPYDSLTRPGQFLQVALNNVTIDNSVGDSFIRNKISPTARAV